MWTKRTVLYGVLAAAASALLAAPAGADGQVTVTPSAPIPGERVTVRVLCDSALPASAASPATGHIMLHPITDGIASADLHIHRDAEPGLYEMTVRCGMHVWFRQFSITTPSDIPATSPWISRLFAWGLTALSLMAVGVLLFGTRRRDGNLRSTLSAPISVE
jgi:hypothetical protein